MKSLRSPRSIFALTLCALAPQAAIPARAQTSFPFALPWDDASKNAVDVSFLNPAPLEEKHRIVVKGAHFTDQTGRRVRFLAVNFVYSTNFPDKDQAEKMAARLHKFGVNLVRLHHIDTLRAPNGIFDANSTDTQKLDPDQLDRLDYLVSQLKKNGIYVDLNLLVGRRFTADDGIADAGSLPNYGKAISWYDPRLIELQKQYAKAMIERVNPYTKMRWADDPAVALIEINNEDTLLGPNRAELFTRLSDTFRKPIYDGWNAFLAKKYTATAPMLAAWNTSAQPYGDNVIANGRFEPDSTGWQVDSILNPVKMSVDAVDTGGPAGHALHLQLTNPVTPATPVKLSFVGPTLKRGQVYRLQFWAKSATPNRPLNLVLKVNKAPFPSLGLLRGIVVTANWTKYACSFTATSDAPGQLNFILNTGPAADLWLADIALQSGNAIELPDGQTLEAHNIALPLISATGQGADFYTFIMQVEDRYTTDMRAYIKDTLSAKSPVTCSQSGWGGLGGLVRESKFDYVDMHAYWDLAESYDLKNFTIQNTPMVRQNDGATYTTLATSRLEGKPYTISEYNTSSPNEYAAETVPFIAAFAAWQDWDGIFLFDYHSNRKTLTGNDKVSTFLDIDSNPSKMAYLPAAAMLFLGGQMPPAAAPATLVVPRNQVATTMAMVSPAPSTVFGKQGSTGKDLLRQLVSVRLVNGDGPVRVEKQPAPALNDAALSWQADDKNTAFFKLVAPTARFLVGFPSAKWQSVDGLSVTPEKTANGFVSLTLNSRDAKPMRDSGSMLLTIGSTFENKGQVWNEKRNSLLQWGDGPVQAEGVTATINLETHNKEATVYALDATGARTKKVPSQLQNGQLSFATGPQYQTVWYEIEGR